MLTTPFLAPIERWRAQLERVAESRKPARAIVPGPRQVRDHPQIRFGARGELVELELESTRAWVVEHSDSTSHGRHVVSGPPSSEFGARVVQPIDELEERGVLPVWGGVSAKL